MKFLDLNGLTHFWNKIKDWSNSNFFSKRGGEIHPTSGLQYIINGEQLDVSKSSNENSTISVFNVDENGMNAMSIRKTGGTATQVLMADGSVKTLNANNGIAGLDANGNVPLAQLGNLDTTFAEVVTTLPTSNIKKHIYLVADTDGVIQNHYTEYIYNGDVNATYDESKWEKLGDFRASVDLADYAKKSEAMHRAVSTISNNTVYIEFKSAAGSSLDTFVLSGATASKAGVMSSTDRIKLDGIENNANNYSLPTASSTIKGGITLGYPQSGKNYPVALDSNGKAYVNVPWTDTTYDLTSYAKKNEAVGSFEILPTATYIQLVAKSIDGTEVDWPTLDPVTSTVAGIMKPSDKNKLDGIASGATADSAITTAEIDTLFA